MCLDHVIFHGVSVWWSGGSAGRDEEGVHQLVYKSIMKCDIDVRSLAYNNIILVGGSTMFPG